ncbi:MAG TPA: DUF2071 domain-containing protein [Pirellulales bacterium]|nr:DUF2071 domain-containing protein [Pirellulales bacterium]
MRIPIVRGLIDRRVLVNFRIDPDVMARVLPPPFRPQVVGSFGIGGICLIRLKHLRPRFLPGVVGIASENAAHRFAVEWDGAGGRVERGVYIPRRDSSSWFNVLTGGRLFPGMHHHARFDVEERHDAYRIAIDSDDRQTHLALSGRIADVLPADSAFGTLERASEFFEKGSLGYSATARSGRFDGLELRSFTWSMTPLAVDRVESSFFADRTKFPAESIEFDSALLMRGIEHEWHGRQMLCCSA